MTSVDIEIALAALGSELPAPWQLWAAPGERERIPGIAPRATWRAAARTPFPAGVARLPDDEPTVAEMATAISYLKDVSVGRDSLYAELARGALADQEQLRKVVQRARGFVHPLAHCAPLRLATLVAAVDEHVNMWDGINSPLTCLTIRAALPAGYQTWRGVGGMLLPVGVYAHLGGAMQRGIAAIREARAEYHAALPQDWSSSTPVFDSTLGAWVEDLAITVRRGPISGGGSSWDLPVVAVVRGADIEARPYRLDDNASRIEARDREREGNRRQQVAQGLALNDLRTVVPSEAFEASGRRVRAGLALRDGSGRVCGRTIGDVRLRADGALGLVLCELNGRRTWAALGRVLHIDGVTLQ